jgi:all-trans-retinol 13,14-reductase
VKTFLVVKLALVPFFTFLILTALGYPTLGLDLGALLGAAFMIRNLALGLNRPIETALFAVLTAAAVARHAGFGFSGPQISAVLFLALGMTGLGTCLSRRPWTTAYSEASHREAAASPLFMTVNLILSVMWSIIFLVIATLRALHFSPLWTLAAVAFGLVCTILGPRAAKPHGR